MAISDGGLFLPLPPTSQYLEGMSQKLPEPLHHSCSPQTQQAPGPNTRDCECQGDIAGLQCDSHAHGDDTWEDNDGVAWTINAGRLSLACGPEPATVVSTPGLFYASPPVKLSSKVLRYNCMLSIDRPGTRY